MKLQLGELVLLRLQFHQSAGSKVRPGVVVLDAGDDDFVAAPVTSQSRKSEFDLPSREWQAAGLNVGSSIRIHKLTVISKVEIARSLGRLSRFDREALVQSLRLAFCGREHAQAKSGEGP